MIAYDAKTSSPRTSAAKAGTYSPDGTPVSIAAAAPIPPRSAAMFTVLATSSSEQANQSRRRE